MNYTQLMEAEFAAGRASRDAEVEALQADLTTHRELMVRQLAGNQALRDEVEALKAERDCAVAMLAGWCVDVDMGGSGWDYWDEHYKTAMYRLNPIRKLLDQAIDAARKERQA